MTLLSEDPQTYLLLKSCLETEDINDWMKIAQATGIPNILSQVSNCRRGGSDVDALLNFLFRHKVTVAQLHLLLEKAELFRILIKMKGVDPLRILSYTPEDGELSVAVNQPVLLCVEAEGSFPIYKWIKDGVEQKETSNRLVIESFNIDLQGHYLCQVSHDPKYVDFECDVVEKHFTLTLQPYLPSITSVMPDLIISEGEQIALKCSTEGFPQPSIRWFAQHGGKVMQLRTSVIEECTLEDTGLYQCVVWNPLGDCKSRRIKVQVKPKEKVPSKPCVLSQPSVGESAIRGIGQKIVLGFVVKCSMNVDFHWSVNGNVLQGISGVQYSITNKVETDGFTHRSFLTYTVSHHDPIILKLVCLALSPDGTICSDQVQVSVQRSTQSATYTARNKIALLIGNSDYKSQAPPLFTPKGEIRRLAKELQELDFEVLMLYDIGLTELRETIRMISMTVSPGDYLLFLYAGHGFYNGEDQLMTVPQCDSNVRDTLSFTHIRKMLQKNNPALLFCVLDMCRQVVPTQTEAPPSLRQYEVEAAPANKNYICLNATSEGYSALENPNESSVLSGSLLEHLSEPVDVLELCTRVIEDIGHKTLEVRKVQVPKLTSDMFEKRSLCDTKSGTSLNSFYWNMAKKLPRKQFMEVALTGTRTVQIGVDFDREIEDISSNVFYMKVSITTSIATDLQVSFEPNFPCKQEGKPTLFRVEGAQKLKNPLKLSIKMKYKDNDQDCQKLFQIAFDLPGIARLNLPVKLITPVSTAANGTMNVM